MIYILFCYKLIIIKRNGFGSSARLLHFLYIYTHMYNYGIKLLPNKSNSTNF